GAHAPRFIITPLRGYEKGSDLRFLCLGDFVASFEFLDRFGPIFLQKTREGPIRQEPSFGLAGGAIVGFVRFIPDALDPGTTSRTSLVVPAMNGHAFAKGGHFFRELVPILSAKTAHPLIERCACRLKQPAHFFIRKLLSHGKRREFGFPQDLI